MTEVPPRRCWDSCCLIAIIKDEQPHAPTLRRLLEDAQNKNIEIVVSTMVITEVVRPRSSAAPVDRARFESVIRNFFESDLIQVISHDRAIAEIGRELCWKHGLHPRDSIHFATALREKCAVLETTDGQLHGYDGKIDGLQVRLPKWEGQMLLKEQAHLKKGGASETGA